MKVRLDFPFLGVLLIIAHLVGETRTLRLFNHQWVPGSFISVIVPVMLNLNFFTTVQCTTTDSEMRAFALQNDHGKEVGHDATEQRQPRVIKELTMLNRQSCLRSILCGVEVAKPPSSSSSTMNDYAFIVKSFFDVLSLNGRNKKKSANQDLDDDDDHESEEEEDDIETPIRSKSKRKNSKKPYSISSGYGGDPDIEDTYFKDLEDLINERDNFFRRRVGKIAKNCTLLSKDCKTSRLLGGFRKPGFMGYSNPRFDKTAFLDKKQLQIEQAANEQEKLKIAGQVADKFQSQRQCRLLSWFRPSYTTTTTITTTSNDPSHSQNQNAVNCPFTVSELQTIIGSSEGNIKTFAAGSNVGTASSTVGVTQHDAQTQAQIMPQKLEYRPQPKPVYQIFPKRQSTTTPIPLSVYGESDPDLELIKDPLYSLVPPEYSKQSQQGLVPQFQTFGFNQLKHQQNLHKPVSHPPENQIPTLQQTLQYFQTTTEEVPKYDDPKYSKFFYLNSDEPTNNNQLTLSTKKQPQTQVVKSTPNATSTTAKPAPVSEEEDDEDTDADASQEDDDQMSQENVNSPPHPPPQGYQNDLGMRHIVGHTIGHSSKIGFRIPNKIRISLPSIRRLTFRQDSAMPLLNPVDHNSDESREGFRKGLKRQTNPNQQKQLVFKTNLEYDMTVKDQQAPDFIFTKTPPSNLNKQLLSKPPLPPKSQNNQNPDDDENSEEDDEDDEDEERSAFSSQANKYGASNYDVGLKQNNEEQKYEEDANKGVEGNDSEENQDDDSNEQSPTETVLTEQNPRKPAESVSSTRKPLIHLPSILRSKSKQTQNPSSTKPTLSSIQQKQQGHKSSNNSTGLLRQVLSPHGMRTLSSITSLFYGSKQDEVHPHEGPPPPGPPPKKGPKRRRRPPPRRRPRPRPHHDQGDDDEEDDEESNEDDESVEVKKVTLEKKPPTPIPPLHPIRMPPKIVAIPIFLEGKEAWEGDEKPHEEEFFEPKPKKKTTPDKYDYDGQSVESRETTNSAEGIDFGPGQNIQTEYSNIVDKVKRPGLQNPNNDRYVQGLPMTWGDMFEELKRQKQVEKLKKKQNVNNSGSDEESAEEPEYDYSGPPQPPPSRRKVQRRRRPRPSQHSYNGRPPPPYHFSLEPID